MEIPGSTRVHESRVLNAPVERVWEVLRPLDFSWLSNTVKEAKIQNGASAEVGSQRRITYSDGTDQTVKLLELSDLEYFLTYDVIQSEPAVTVTSALHTLRLRRVTHDNTTLIEWISDYSNDAAQSVLQDSKFKKQEGFEALLKFLAGSKKRPASPVKASPAKKK